MSEVIKFLRSRKKYLLVSLIATTGFLALFTYLSRNFMLVMTVRGQECFPYKHWLVKKTKDLHIGEFVAFRGYGIPNRLRKNANFLKIFSGERCF